MKKNPILVTGIHRSGSTFVGKMLCLDKDTAYIQEPFNRYYGLECIDARFKYLNDGLSTKKLKNTLDDLVHLKRAKYNITSVTEEEKVIVTRNELLAEMLSNINFNNIHKYFGKLLFRAESQLRFNLLKYTPRINRVLLKDPEAAFASQYLHQRYDMNVVILVRHPLSFAGSLKRLGWRFDLSNFLRQEQLMEDYLDEFRKELIDLNQKETTVIEEACMIWNCVYSVLSNFIANNSSFLVYRHETIAQQPLQSFKDIYKKLGLNFTAEIEYKINTHTSVRNPVTAKDNRVHQLKRNSAELIYKWQRLLTPDEIAYIKHKTKKVRSMFYNSNFFEETKRTK